MTIGLARGACGLRGRCLAVGWVLLLLAVGLPCGAAVTTATWTGAVSEDFGDRFNWQPEVTPQNTESEQYAVVVPGDAVRTTVRLNNNTTVSGIGLSAGADLIVGGHAGLACDAFTTISNSGALRFESGRLILPFGCAFEGDGELEFSGIGHPADLVAAGQTVVNGPGHTIVLRGGVWGNLVNEGRVVLAEETAHLFAPPDALLVNAGRLEVESSATVHFVMNDLTGGGETVLGPGTMLRLTDCATTGQQITGAAESSVVRLEGETSATAWGGVTTTGTIRFASGSTVPLTGVWQNHGLAIVPGDVSTTVAFRAKSRLEGAGRLQVEHTTNSVLLDDGHPITIGTSQTVWGAGTLIGRHENGGAVICEQLGDLVVRPNGATTSNTGHFRSAGPGNLIFEHGNYNPAGTVRIDDGQGVVLWGHAVSGRRYVNLKLECAKDGLVRIRQSTAGILPRFTSFVTSGSLRVLLEQTSLSMGNWQNIGETTVSQLNSGVVIYMSGGTLSGNGTLWLPLGSNLINFDNPSGFCSSSGSVAGGQTIRGNFALSGVFAVDSTCVLIADGGQTMRWSPFICDNRERWTHFSGTMIGNPGGAIMLSDFYAWFDAIYDGNVSTGARFHFRTNGDSFIMPVHQIRRGLIEVSGPLTHLRAVYSDSAFDDLNSIWADGTLITTGGATVTSYLGLSLDGQLHIGPNSTYQAGSSISQSGGLLHLEGNLKASPNYSLNGGLFRGAGHTTAHILANAGTVQVGAPIGKLSAQMLSVAKEGIVEFTLAGTSPGISHDFIKTTGTTNLNGTLRIMLETGYTPNIGDQFVIISASSVQGQFQAVELPQLPPGMRMVIEYTENTVSARIASNRLPMNAGIGDWESY